MREGIVVSQQRKRRHLSRPVAAAAACIDDGRDVLAISDGGLSEGLRHHNQNSRNYNATPHTVTFKINACGAASLAGGPNSFPGTPYSSECTAAMTSVSKRRTLPPA